MKKMEIRILDIRKCRLVVHENNGNKEMQEARANGNKEMQVRLMQNKRKRQMKLVNNAKESEYCMLTRWQVYQICHK